MLKYNFFVIVLIFVECDFCRMIFCCLLSMVEDMDVKDDNLLVEVVGFLLMIWLYGVVNEFIDDMLVNVDVICFDKR